MSKTVLTLFAACVGLSLLSLNLVKQMRAGEATIAELQAQVAALQQQKQSPPPVLAPAPLASAEPPEPSMALTSPPNKPRRAISFKGGAEVEEVGATQAAPVAQ